jgi:hypothetical protein
MSPSDESPLHDFADRSIREQLQNPANLRDLLRDVVPHLVDGFDFAKSEFLKPQFPLEGWRYRESDLLFRVPYRAAEGEMPVLVCVLIEHQSRPDPRMPLRTLLYAVLYWEREWKEWEKSKPPRPPFQLSPVLPIVFHTGPGPWNSNRRLTDLLARPELFHAFAPQWEPFFWDLAERSPETLLRAAGEWLQALAVVRAEREPSDAFMQVLSGVLQQLQDLHRSP